MERNEIKNIFIITYYSSISGTYDVNISKLEFKENLDVSFDLNIKEFKKDENKEDLFTIYHNKNYYNINSSFSANGYFKIEIKFSNKSILFLIKVYHKADGINKIKYLINYEKIKINEEKLKKLEKLELNEHYYIVEAMFKDLKELFEK